MQEKLVTWFSERLPALRNEKSPTAAAVVAFLFGGFGLAVYLRSALDAAVAAISVAAVFVAVGAGAHIGTLAILGALAEYAYTRVEASNRRLRASNEPELSAGAPLPVT